MGSNLVVKSNRLIQASYRLSLGEQRIILFAISELKKIGGFAALPDGFIYIRASAYAEMFGMPTDQAYEQLKDAGSRIFDRYVLLHEVAANGDAWIDRARWVSRGGYQDREGVIRLKFTEDMRTFIVELESRFTQYKIEFIAKMTSTHAIRLYELLVQWRGRGWREVEIEWLKTALGIDVDAYTSIKDFKKWVIDVAVSQINEFSDLTASYTQRKTGRNVTHLIFTFAPKEDPKPPQAQPHDAAADVRGSALFQRLRGLGIGAKLAADWIKRDEAHALASADYVEAKAKAGQVKGSAAGYLRTVFESGADLGPSAFEADLKAKARDAAEAKKREEAEKRRQDQAKIKATEKAKESMSALSPEQRAIYAREWLDSGKAGRAVWDDKRGDFREAVDRIGFKLWLQNRLAA